MELSCSALDLQRHDLRAMLNSMFSSSFVISPANSSTTPPMVAGEEWSKKETEFVRAREKIVAGGSLCFIATKCQQPKYILENLIEQLVSRIVF